MNKEKRYQRFLAASWWKWLGVILMIAVIVAGFLVPLKPGITDVYPIQAKAGERVEFSVVGYNTSFTDKTRVWLKHSDEHLLAAQDIRVVSPRQLKVEVDFPSNIPSSDANIPLTMIVDTPGDGYSVLPSAIFLKGNGNVGSVGWTQTISHLHESAGFFFPNRNILNETIRSTFFHVPLWFSMFILLIASVVFSTKYLRGGHLDDDIIASALVRAAVLFGMLGMITGSLWARYTWGTFWTADVKLNMSAVAMLIYVAYIILRSSIKDVDRRAQLSSGYAIFAFVALIPLVIVIPRLTDSLHPGNGGNPAIGSEDMDNTMRIFFYPAVIGFTLMGMWISSQIIRLERLKNKYLDLP